MNPGMQYNYVNLDYITELVDGEKELLIELIDTFLITIPPVLEKLKIAVDAHDYTNIYFYAHKLKGSFNFIGSTQLSNTFTLIEQYSADITKQEMIQGLLQKISISTVHVMAELERIKTSEDPFNG